MKLGRFGFLRAGRRIRLPPVPENWVLPRDSLAHWPVRSISMVELMDTMLSIWPIT